MQYVFIYHVVFGQETAKGPFGLRVKLPPAHLSSTHGGGFTRWSFYTATFNAERQAGKLWIPIFYGFWFDATRNRTRL